MTSDQELRERTLAWAMTPSVARQDETLSTVLARAEVFYRFIMGGLAGALGPSDEPTADADVADLERPFAVEPTVGADDDPGAAHIVTSDL